MRKFLTAVVAVFVATAVLSFLIHGVLLQRAYQITPQLLRAPADFNAHALFLLVSFFFFALGFVWIYGARVEAKPWVAQGIRYGIAVWLIVSVSRYVSYFAIQPWSVRVVQLQIAYEFVMALLLGLIVAAIYRNAFSKAPINVPGGANA
ncbi:MAG TPA: hypothetical protein VFZ08_06750 [Terriglobia bacterium]|nr:hypothetical protein [Terriglobia bacterium]